MEIFLTILSAIYILFIPGLLLSFIFFRQDAIDLIERVALSFALSIAVVPLVTFYANLLGTRITRASVLSEVALINLLAILTISIQYILTQWKTRHGATRLYFKLHDSTLYTKPAEKLPPGPLRVRLNTVFEELFVISLVTYIILLLLETIREGFVSNFFNTNYLLAVVVASGIASAITGFEKKKEEKKSTSQNEWLFILLTGVGGGLLVFYKTGNLGVISLIIGVATTVIILLLSYLLLTDSESVG